MIGTEGEMHGNGLGDINGDGRTDIVTPVGWYECPAEPRNGEWTFHADYLFHRVDQPEQPQSPPRTRCWSTTSTATA